jgi:hypothetical protein
MIPPNGAVIKFTVLPERLPAAPVPIKISVCGDGVCENSENAENCPDDCQKTIAFAAPIAMFTKQGGPIITVLIVLLLAAVIYVAWHKVYLRYQLRTPLAKRKPAVAMLAVKEAPKPEKREVKAVKLSPLIKEFKVKKGARDFRVKKEKGHKSLERESKDLSKRLARLKKELRK